ncbi:hypothetical protein DL770_004665 [Monosporascus sp. CRB-9-2]|nr:hypothetical protein DL770_004665 [Monosporascus sp. CRB-9-2]
MDTVSQGHETVLFLHLLVRLYIVLFYIEDTISKLVISLSLPTAIYALLRGPAQGAVKHPSLSRHFSQLLACGNHFARETFTSYLAHLRERLVAIGRPSSQHPEAAAPPDPAPASPPPRRPPTAADNIATIRRQAERIAALERQLQRMAEYCFECGELSRRTWEGFSDIHNELLFQLHREVRPSGARLLWRAQQRIDLLREELRAHSLLRAQELARRQERSEREQREMRERQARRG